MQIKVNVLLNYRNKAESIAIVNKHNNATAAEIIICYDIVNIHLYVELKYNRGDPNTANKHFEILFLITLVSLTDILTGEFLPVKTSCNVI